MADLYRQKELSGFQEKQCFHREKRNRVCIRTIPYRLIHTGLSCEELWDNICLRYSLMHQENSATCDGWVNRFLIKHDLSCPKGGIILGQNVDDEKEWGALGAQDPTPSEISYKPHINSSKVQGGSTREGALSDGETSSSCKNMYGEAQGIRGNGRMKDGVAERGARAGQLAVPAKLRADISAHGLWKRGNTLMFEIVIVDLDAGSCLHIISEKYLAKAEKENKGK